MQTGRFCLSVAIAWSATGLCRAAVTYDFTLGAGSSLTLADSLIQAVTSGGLIGDYDPETNPEGTRTKPGLFGRFGPTENVEVPTDVDLTAGGGLSVGVQGGFGATFDLAAGWIALSGYSSESVGEPSGGLDLTAHVLTPVFRTRNPDSLYLGGVTIPIPLGSARVLSLGARQLGPAAPGLLTELGAGRYDFTLALPVVITGEVEVLGNAVAVGPLPLVLPLSGSIVVDGANATLSARAAIEASDSRPLDLALPTIPLSLPTLLPPGETAALSLTLTVSELRSALAGESALVAAGVLVPEPTSLATWAVAVCLWRATSGRRRPRIEKPRDDRGAVRH